MVIPKHGSFKDKLRRCIQMGSLPAMAAAACAIPPAKAQADLMFLPDLDHVIDLNASLSATLAITLELDNDPFFLAEGYINLSPSDGIDPNVVEYVQLLNGNGVFHFQTINVPVAYTPGDFVDHRTISASSLSIPMIPLGDFSPGIYVGMQFTNPDTDGELFGYFKIEYDALANTLTLSNFAYETDDFVPALVSHIPGDLNGDGFVGIADLNAVLSFWNLTVPPAPAAADPSGDNFVGIADLNEVLGNWNNGIPPVTDVAVPEPSALIGLGCAMTGVLGRRMRR